MKQEQKIVPLSDIGEWRRSVAQSEMEELGQKSRGIERDGDAVRDGGA